MSADLRAAGILAVGIALGSLRDLLFINLNYQIDHVLRGTAVSYAHSRFQTWTQGWDLHALLWLKWGMAVLFIVAMWALSMALVRNAGASARLARPVTAAFVGIATAAFLLHGLARWVKVAEASVNLLHAIQYPVLLIILQVALIFFPAIRSGPR